MNEWQPIATAPVRDEFGAKISDWLLVRAPLANGNYVYAVAMREHGCEGWLAQLPNGGCQELLREPTHWAPLAEVDGKP